MKIYVDGEMPKECYDCNFTYQEHSFDRVRCLFNGKHICDNKQDCPLQSQAEHDKELIKKIKFALRKQVCQMRDDKHCYPQNVVCWQDVVAILDQVERSEKDETN